MTGARASVTPTNNTLGGSASGKGKGIAKAKGRGTKRKRQQQEESEEESEESEGNMSKLGGDTDLEEGSIVDLPKITQSGRQVIKPTQFIPAAYKNSAKKRAPSKRAQEQALYKKCQRRHSPQNNIIVLDGINNVTILLF